MKRTVRLSLVTLLLFLASVLNAVGAPPTTGVATVVAIRGTVVAQNAKEPARSLALKSQIFQDDEIKTGANGRLQLLFTDNSIISLGGASEMKVAEYRWHPEQNDGALKTQIKEGTFRVMGGAITKSAPQNFKTETPTATIGIRGSMYAGIVTPTTLSVVFQGGKGIDITNPFGTVAITKPGFGTHVSLNAAPAPPVKFTEKDLGALNKQLNGNGGKTDAAPAEEKNGATTPPSTGTQEGTTSEGEQTPAPATETTSAPASEPLSVLAALTTSTIGPIAIDLPPTNEYPSTPIYFSTPPPPPSDGIYVYQGILSGTSTKISGTSSEPISDSLYLSVNWYSHKLAGIVYDDTKDGPPVFFYGSLSGSTVPSITILGGDNGGPNPSTNQDVGFISGGGSGLFLGSAYDFFSFNATGNSYSVKTQSPLDSWTVSGSGQQLTSSMTPTSPTGTEKWQGFVVGVSENMSAPDADRSLFLNSDPSQFWFNIDKDAGTITGAMTTDSDLNGSQYKISNMTVGGSFGSAYIRNDLLGAGLGCSGNCIDNTNNLYDTSLKQYGNYMVVAKIEKKWSNYFTWGYWEVAYTDLSDDPDTERHIHVPYSFWLAGKPTDVHPVSSFTGNYSCNVNATKLSMVDSKEVATPVTGTFTLQVDFAGGSTNTIAATNITLSPPSTPNDTYTLTTAATSATFSGTLNGGNSFSTAISGAGTGGTLKGAFYGPNAEAVGGNFYTSGTAPNLKYIGIFGGNR